MVMLNQSAKEIEELTETVARAICLSEFENPHIYWGLDPIAVAVEQNWPDYKDAALAAIKAVAAVYTLLPIRIIDND